MGEINDSIDLQRYPYLQLPTNKDYDLDTVPKGY